MSKKLKKLKEERAKKLEELKALIGIEDTEELNLSEEQEKQFQALRSEVETLNSQIEDEESKEDLRRQIAADQAPPKPEDKRETDIQKVQKRYSITKAIRGFMDGNLDGVEKEMHQECENAARENGAVITGIGVPAFAFNRGLSVGVAADGGNTVEEELGSLIEILRPKLKVMEMGITAISGLRGNLTLPKQTGKGNVAWEGETTESSETKPAFGQLNWTPKRVAAWEKYSKMLFYQSSLGVDQLVANDLTRALSQALDEVVINGTGAGQPQGILNLAGVNNLAIGDNGGAPTYDHLVQLEEMIATANADLSTMGFLTTPGVRSKLKRTKFDAGSGEMVWGKDNMLNGYKAEVSNLVPKGLTKGTSTDCHALLFGVWSQYLLGSWGFIDLLANPYTLAKKAEVEVTINGFFDGKARHDEAFASIKDARVA